MVTQLLSSIGYNEAEIEEIVAEIPYEESSAETEDSVVSRLESRRENRATEKHTPAPPSSSWRTGP